MPPQPRANPRHRNGQNSQHHHDRQKQRRHPDAQSKKGRVRREEFAAACKILKVSRGIVLDYPDGQLHRLEMQRVVSDLVLRIREFRPQVLLTFDPGGSVTGHTECFLQTRNGTQGTGLGLAQGRGMVGFSEGMVLPAGDAGFDIFCEALRDPAAADPEFGAKYINGSITVVKASSVTVLAAP